MKKISLIFSLFLFITPLISLAAFSRDLYYGVLNDSDVTELQEFLTSHGVYKGPVTGNFLALTQEGVKNFQKRENIEPSAGYFGPLTRTRANELLAKTPLFQDKRAIELVKKITELQNRLRELQALQKAEDEAKNQPPFVETATTTSPADTTAPSFTVRPRVAKAEFINPPLPLGVHYPYRIQLDWSVDESGYVTESVTCSPPLKFEKARGKLTEYFPEPHASYGCTVSVKDAAENEVKGDVEFDSPSWVSVDGVSNKKFPLSSATPLKVGDVTIYNGSTTDVLFDQIVMKITDNLNSALNRGREVNLVLRKGIEVAGDQISKTTFTFHSLDPVVLGVPHAYLINLSYPVLYAAGEERSFSLWIENLEYVVSGSLKFELDKFQASTAVKKVNGFALTLSR